MPCLCTTSTLRSFIRSLSQVEVNAPAVYTSRRSLQNAATRSFRRQYSQASTLPWVDRHNEEKSPPHVRHPPAVSNRRSQESSMGGGPHTQVDADDAISEISPESIDAIAAEAKHQNPYEQTPEIYTNTTTKGKEAFSADAPSRTTFRRTKVQNTSLAIHFSHPRAPLETASASGQNIRVGSKSDSKSPSSKEAKLSKEDDWTPPPREPWMIHKEALKQKFPEGWNTHTGKRLSPDALAGIRALHAQMPELYTTKALAESFKVSPEAIRRILKSKWSPSSEEETERQRRWFNRGKQIYTRHAEMGQKPPKRWRELGIGDGKPEWMLRKARAAARPPLPALLTTTRRRTESEDPDRLADEML